MKIKIVRESGRPIELDKIEDYENERKVIFDVANSEHVDRVANDGMSLTTSIVTFQEELAKGDELLNNKYDTISEIEFPKTVAQMKKLLSSYVSIETFVHCETGELVFKILDMEG